MALSVVHNRFMRKGNEIESSALLDEIIDRLKKKIEAERPDLMHVYGGVEKINDTRLAGEIDLQQTTVRRILKRKHQTTIESLGAFAFLFKMRVVDFYREMLGFDDVGYLKKPTSSAYDYSDLTRHQIEYIDKKVSGMRAANKLVRDDPELARITLGEANYDERRKEGRGMKAKKPANKKRKKVKK